MKKAWFSQGQVKGRGKDMGTFDKVPLTGGKSYYNKQEGDWWQQANLPERLDDNYSEMESTTILGTSFSLPRVCLVLPLLFLILGLVFSLLHLPPVFLGEVKEEGGRVLVCRCP
jgi:hypothetical protein